MINMMLNTGQIEAGGREHGGKGWEGWIWRGQRRYLAHSISFSFLFNFVLVILDHYWSFLKYNPIFYFFRHSYMVSYYVYWVWYLKSWGSTVFGVSADHCHDGLFSWVYVHLLIWEHFLAKIKMWNSKGNWVDDPFLQRICISFCKIPWTVSFKLNPVWKNNIQKRLSFSLSPSFPPVQSHDGGRQISSCVPIVDVQEFSSFAFHKQYCLWAVCVQPRVSLLDRSQTFFEHLFFPMGPWFPQGLVSWF